MEKCVAVQALWEHTSVFEGEQRAATQAVVEFRAAGTAANILFSACFSTMLNTAVDHFTCNDDSVIPFFL